MKKLLIVLLLAVLTMPAFSQDAFKRSKFFNIGYVNSTLTPEDEEGLQGNYGFSLSLGNRYWLNKKPIAGMMKIAIDAIWFDANYVNLKTKSYDNDYDYGYDDDEIFDEINTGSHQIELGLGVGPSITVAPFAMASNQLKNLRASLFFHVVPSFSGVLMDNGDGDLKLNYGFVPFLKFGGCINWKALSIFAEGRWGSANYKMASTSDIEDPETDDIISFDKWSMKTSSVRFGIGISF
ncbi:MAG: hypothetical protein K2K25_10725 [Muribaculaceae bacterium]|nr:hypothetical protein [Muribaculaceae bacterium]